MIREFNYWKYFHTVSTSYPFTDTFGSFMPTPIYSSIKNILAPKNIISTRILLRFEGLFKLLIIMKIKVINYFIYLTRPNRDWLLLFLTLKAFDIKGVCQFGQDFSSFCLINILSTLVLTKRTP
jgi:hypothetical protein